MTPRTVGIIGLGLIGGTLAKTIRRLYPDTRILACDTNAATIRQGLSEGVITQGFPAPDPAFSQCSYFFLCAPVQENETFLAELSGLLSDQCILTDTGSVKASIHADIRRLGLSRYFIGGHPMAGSEKSGYSNATPYLFENAYYILTPEPDVPAALLEEFRTFIGTLGCIPLVLDPEQHDYMTAAVSHLPHVLASSLIHLVMGQDDQAETMKSIAAGGFKDITRIASSSPVMWQEICLTNRKQILALLDDYIHSLELVREDISEENRQKILEFFRSAKDYRDSLSITKTGPLPAIFEIYCDLIDEAGGIATIATILASNNVNIKNIGIIHNREYENGVLRIEFYEVNALKKSVILLQKYHYAVYER